MFRNNLVYRFATKAYDLAVIGGGPGGNSIYQTQDMLLPSRLLNWVSILSVLKREEAWVEHVST
jgi:hypothetical protein